MGKLYGRVSVAKHNSILKRTANYFEMTIVYCAVMDMQHGDFYKEELKAGRMGDIIPGSYSPHFHPNTYQRNLDTILKMVAPTRPPRNGFNAAMRKVYNPLGFSKAYNFILWFIFAGALFGFSLSRCKSYWSSCFLRTPR